MRDLLPRLAARHCRPGTPRAVAVRWLVVAVVGLLIPLAPLARVGMAQEAEGGKTAQFDLLEPVRNELGASAWLAATGQDPRLADVPTGEAAATVTDWSRYGAADGGATRSGTAAAPLVPFRSAAPAFSRNLIVTRQLGLFPLQTEPNIVVDPLDPMHLVMGTIDYNYSAMSVYVSFDGGATWEGPKQVPYFLEDVSAAGDPVLAFDRAGNVYMTSISLGFEPYRLGALVSYAEVSSMTMSVSTDGGLTWSDTISAARSKIETTSSVDQTGRERGEVALDFLDKPWITVGPNPTNPDLDTIYLVYTEFKTRYGLLYADELPILASPVTETTIQAVHSNDGGKTWSDPTPVSPTVFQSEGAGREPGEGEGGVGAALRERAIFSPMAEGDGDPSAQAAESQTQESDQTVQGAQPRVLSDGTVVVAYLDTTADGVQKGLGEVMVATSTDGGQSFGEPVQAGVFQEIHFTPRNSDFRWWGASFPQIAVGPKDEIYVAVTARPPDKPTDDGDIYLFRSLDKGQTFLDPVRLNQDDTDHIQFFPSIAVSPNGTLHAMWGDMRDDPDKVRYHIYYTQSSDQGATWGFSDPVNNITQPDTRATDFASNSLKGFPGGRFLGDYFSIAASDDDVYLVWADTRLGEYGGPNQQIAFARRTAITPPSLFLNPPSGPAGRDVTIQGFGFEPDANLYVDVGGVTQTNLRTDDKGQFTTTIYMPVTGEGPRDVTALDETGNVASASFYTEFGFDSIARELQALQNAAGVTPAAGTPVPEATPQP